MICSFLFWVSQESIFTIRSSLIRLKTDTPWLHYDVLLLFQKPNEVGRLESDRQTGDEQCQDGCCCLCRREGDGGKPRGRLETFMSSCQSYVAGGVGKTHGCIVTFSLPVSVRQTVWRLGPFQVMKRYCKIWLKKKERFFLFGLLKINASLQKSITVKKKNAMRKTTWNTTTTCNFLFFFSWKSD